MVADPNCRFVCGIRTVNFAVQHRTRAFHLHDLVKAWTEIAKLFQWSPNSFHFQLPHIWLSEDQVLFGSKLTASLRSSLRFLISLIQ